MPWKSSAMARSTAVASLLWVACSNCCCRSRSWRSKAETGLEVWARARVAVRMVAHSRAVGRIVCLLRHDFTSCCILFTVLFVQTQSVVPPGLESFVALFPALKRWAKFGRSLPGLLLAADGVPSFAKPKAKSQIAKSRDPKASQIAKRRERAKSLRATFAKSAAPAPRAEP